MRVKLEAKQAGSIPVLFSAVGYCSGGGGANALVISGDALSIASFLPGTVA